MNHSSYLVIHLRLCDYFRQILQNESSRRKVRVLRQDMGNVDSGVASDINNKRRSVVQCGPVQQLRSIIYLSPRRLPCGPGLHVSSESFIVGGTLLQSPEKVEVIWVSVGVVVRYEVRGFFV